MMDLDLRMSVSLFIPPHPFSLLLFVGRNGKLPLSTLPYEFDEDQASAAATSSVSSSNLMCHKMFQKDILLLLGVLIKFS